MTNNNTNIPPKLLVINDMAGVGRCSLSVALPVISCCKVQACPLPTAIFSNHLGFASHYSVDLSKHLPEFFAYLNFLPVDFDGVCCGFLNSTEQIINLKNYFSSLDRSVPVFLDPVMGDHGKAYRTVTADFILELRNLLPYTTLITPNLTEACLLTDTPYANCFSPKELELLCQKLLAMGPKKVVITGIEYENEIANALFEDSFQMIHQTKISPSRPGTGDILFSIISALLMRNFSLYDAAKYAAAFIEESLKASKGVPILEGVALENCLHLLTSL